MLKAMARLHTALEGLDARMILQIHDELLIESATDAAPQAAAILEENMVAAYRELFPDAPTVGLVDVVIRNCWAKPEKK
jgi:DNA polymerase-1